MRSFILISISLVLLVLGRSISRDSDQLKRVVWHHDNKVMMRDISSYPSLFSQFENKFGFYPKHYERLDSLHLKYIKQQMSLTKNQLRELNALCDSLNVDRQDRTIPMKLNACLSSYDFTQITFFDPKREIVVTHIEESLDSVEMTIALVYRSQPQERIAIEYYLDGEVIDTSRLRSFEGNADKMTAESYNQVTGQCRYYSMQ